MNIKTCIPYILIFFTIFASLTFGMFHNESSIVFHDTAPEMVYVVNPESHTIELDRHFCVAKGRSYNNVKFSRSIENGVVINLADVYMNLFPPMADKNLEPHESTHPNHSNMDCYTLTTVIEIPAKLDYGKYVYKTVLTVPNQLYGAKVIPLPDVNFRYIDPENPTESEIRKSYTETVKSLVLERSDEN